MSTLQPPPLTPSRQSLPTSTTPGPRPTPPPRHHRIRWTILSVTLVAIIVLITGGWLFYRAISVINTKKLDGSRLSFFQQLTRFVTTRGDQLPGQAEDRINILLLGYGGPGHDGPYLTDTMMVASIQPSTKQVALLSIPRDLVVDIPGYDFRKINSVLSFGRDDNYPGGGEALAVKVVSDLLNLPIQYYARVDFNGFIDVVDQVGGVTVNVEKAFTDYQYPDNNYGYDPISFKAGQQMMDGALALKYSRSRHGGNGEGSDFARAARQQQIITALKDKFLSFGTLTNPKKISDVLGSLGSHSQTNMEVWEILRLTTLVGNIKSDEIINKVFDDSADGFLRAATGQGGAFILLPRGGDYHDMQFLARNIFLDGAADTETASILVVNATGYTNLGSTAKQALEALGLNVVKATTLTGTPVGQTILVSHQPGKYPATEQLLSLFTRAAGSIDTTAWVKQTGDTTVGLALSTPLTLNANRTLNTNTTRTVTPDLVLVLGLDQPKPTATTAAKSTVSPSVTNTHSSVTTNTNQASNTNSKSTNTNAGSKSTTNTNTQVNASGTTPTKKSAETNTPTEPPIPNSSY